MKILITNANMSQGGAQSFVRLLASGLQRSGHSVVVYTSDMEKMEPLFHNEPLTVTNDLENLPFEPDVIHGQHYLDTMVALTALTQVPAINHSHGAIWKDHIVKHPRIYRYLAMSRSYAGRIAVESNIPPDRIEVFLNGVDLVRFARVRSVPERPRRALFFNRHHKPDSGTLVAIRAATSRTGLELDCIGFYLGGLTSAPENILPNYDIVFASGLSAIEAMASGCAVIALGRASCGPMVLPENFEKLREANFSIATNSPPPDSDMILAELSRYSRDNCEKVTARLRDEGDFSKHVHRLVKIYEQVIDEHRRTKADLRAEALASSRYLRSIFPLIRVTDEMLGADGPRAASPGMPA